MCYVCLCDICDDCKTLIYIAPKGLTSKRHHNKYDSEVFEDRRDITIIKFVFSSWRKVNNVGRILLDTLFDTYKKKNTITNTTIYSKIPKFKKKLKICLDEIF